MSQAAYSMRATTATMPVTLSWVACAMGQIQGVLATVDDELGIEYKQPGFYD